MSEIGIVVDGDVWRIGDVWGHYVGFLMLIVNLNLCMYAGRKLVIIACRASSECAARAASSANSISCISTRRTFFSAFSLVRL